MAVLHRFNCTQKSSLNVHVNVSSDARGFLLLPNFAYLISEDSGETSLCASPYLVVDELKSIQSIGEV